MQESIPLVSCGYGADGVEIFKPAFEVERAQAEPFKYNFWHLLGSLSLLAVAYSIGHSA